MSLERARMDMLCDVAEDVPYSSIDTYQPCVSLFNDWPPLLQIIDMLYRVNKSCVFERMWKESCDQFEEDFPAVDVVIEMVWKPTIERYGKFVKHLKTGEIEFMLVQQFIGKKCGTDIDLMRAELEYLGLDETMINERLIQIEKHWQVKHFVDFANHNSKATKISDFDAQLVEACAILQRVTAQQTGPKELKVFIELALNTAGENQMNVKKVQCLQEAVDGYSSLIFDLSTNDGYTELLEKCASVWNILEQRPELSEKILDSNRQTSWFQEIKMFHGSVEVSSLIQADTINTKGTIYIGQKVIDIKERGTADLIFENVMRLCDVYIQLCLSGCVLFNDWNVEFLCSPELDQPICATMEFDDAFTLVEKCTKDDVNESMKEANINVLEIAQEQKAERERSLANKSQSEKDAQKKLAFLQKLDEMSIEEDLAERSLAHVSNEDIETLDTSNALVWCMEEQERIEDSKKENDKGTQKTLFLHSGSSLMATINEKMSHTRDKREIGSAPLIGRLGDLWKNFLHSISTSISDFLSLDHLGLVLKNLQQKDERKVRRSLTPNMKEGEPNLLVCQEDRFNSDTDLFVNILTRKGAWTGMDIFLRRVFSGDDNKIHCLLNVEKLNYDVTEVAEQYVEKYLDKRKEADKAFYKFVVICSSGSECRSNLVSSLEKFTRTRSMVNVQSLQHYLLTKFDIDELTLNDGEDIEPAAALHQQKSTVWVVKSKRTGMGKSLYAERCTTQLATLNKSSCTESRRVTIPLQEKAVNSFSISDQLLQFTRSPEDSTANIIHLDVYPEVQEGLDFLLFNLLILNCLTNRKGLVWRRSKNDLYLIESLPTLCKLSDADGTNGESQCIHEMFRILPDIVCRSPSECLQVYSGVLPNGYQKSDLLFDKEQFCSEVFQRPYRYLNKLDKKESIAFGGGQSIMATGPTKDTDIERKECLSTLIRHCGAVNPSWAELHNFVWFLNTQLVDLENNQFTSASASADLPGFGQFALRFIVNMSRDFSTRSLKISEEVGEEDHSSEKDYVDAFKMRRTWESSPHPYIFINSDRMSFTFLGFSLDRRTGDLKDIKTGLTMEGGSNIITTRLFDALKTNKVQLHDDFDSLKRYMRIL
ncbi:R213A-like protein [Mya arenaria]|uniref:R213A-like protein n=1 Tax=Mya arenaria TaxID=6604 RepID=A0ABY7EPD2_MYAAR|nr:R213A-like protein [Mya arenaria]